jgi:uncharacterized metal-binding protein
LIYACSGAANTGYLADSNIVIDGCPVSCGKQIFERLNLPFIHYKTTDFGVEKGKTKITGEIIYDVSDKIAGMVTSGGC